MFNGYKVIDVHGHQSPPPELIALGFRTLHNRGESNSPRLAPWPPKEPRYAETPEKGKYMLWDNPSRAEWRGAPSEAAALDHVRMLDDRNIDVQFISPRPYGMMHWARPEVVTEWTDITNEAIRLTCDMYPTRFVGIAQLPQHTSLGTSNCSDVLERCINEYGFVGAILNPDPGGQKESPSLDKPYWFPLYEKAEELDATLVVHGAFSFDPRTNENQFLFLVEETLATLRLERGNVFERFPKLRILVVHCGGAPSRHYTRSTSINALPTGGFPSGLFFDTCAYDKDYLRLAISQKGIDRMCFGTELPGAGSNVLNPQTGRPSDDLIPVIEGIAELSDNDRKAILHDNPKRVFPLYKGG